MKNRIGASAVGVCILAVSLLAMAGSANAASKINATLRVVGLNSKLLADKKFKTGTTSVKTSSRATCLGEGSVNGATTVPGATALGLLAQGSTKIAALQPLSISSDLGFGLGLCEIAGIAPPKNNYWALKVDHKFSMVGGADAVLKNGGVALWFLSNFTKANPGELFLKVPSSAKKNKTVKVKVFSYDDKGKKSVVKGASINGAKAPKTNGKGVTKLKLKKTASLTARKSGSIVSNRVKISVKG